MTQQANDPDHLRAGGNLTYLEFISLVKRLWAVAHPDVPIVPSGNSDPAKYPCIVYSLQLRKPHPNEPKVRYRETLTGENGAPFVIGGQRFQNIINFSAVTESNPELAEEVIEIFEDFMLEFTPVMKELGASELVYARRLPDDEENRAGAGVVKRTVAYMVTLEKVISTEYERLNSIMVDARVWLNETHEYPHYLGSGRVKDSPRYYLSIGETQRFYVGPTLVGTSRILMPDTSFLIGDVIYLAPKPESTMPLLPGYYVVINVVGTPWAEDIEYEIASRSNPDVPINPFTIEGEGLAFYIHDDGVSAIITDTHLATPDS